MTPVSSRFYSSGEGDVLDHIVLKHYRVIGSGQLRRVLEANRGLAALGPVLPGGITIELPYIEARQESATVSLWD